MLALFAPSQDWALPIVSVGTIRWWKEWVLGDQAGVARQMGLDPAAVGRELGTTKPGAYAIGNEAMRQRWVDADRFDN